MTVPLKYKYTLFSLLIVLITSLWARNIYLLFGFSIMCWIIIPHKKLWDNSAVSLLVFSLFYGLMIFMNNRLESGLYLLSYLIAPVAFYRLGRWSMTIIRKEYSRQFFLLISILCYLIYLFIITFKDIAIVGIVNETRKLLGDLKDDTLNATLYGMTTSIGIGCIGSIFTNKQNIWLKSGYIIVSMLSLLTIIHLVNRTGLITCLCCILGTLIFSTKYNISKKIGILFIILFVGFIIIRADIIEQDILDAYSKREDNSTYGTSTAGGRSYKWSMALENLFKFPMGWDDRDGHAHNLWLDIARVSGILPLLPFLLTTYSHLKNILYLIRKQTKSNFVILLISINIAMLLSSFVEPVIEGSLLFFCILMMIWGITKNIAMEN